tara:strand:+ start:2842 stop:3867 length:1026 start_codon:yes stop_codon:yes gene_type:complete
MDTAVRMGTRQAIVDNLAFWHRAGQRCISAIFGSQLCDYFPPNTPYGRCDALQDPLDEARQQSMRSTISSIDCNPFSDSAVALQLGSISQKKHTLLLLLSSVEGWLRTGRYCTQQLSAKNSPDIDMDRLSRDEPRVYARSEFQRILQKGVDASVQEMLEAGDCEREEEARVCANAVRDTIEQCLTGCATDTHVVFNFPEGLDDTPKKARTDTVLNKHDVNIAAIHTASSAIAAGFCQGPMVHHQFSYQCFLTSKYDRSECADCESSVHVLSASFLSTRFGACPRCARPRCFSCETAAIEFARANSRSKGLDEGCLRCREPRQTPAKVSPPKSKSGKKKKAI